MVEPLNQQKKTNLDPFNQSKTSDPFLLLALYACSSIQTWLGSTAVSIVHSLFSMDLSEHVLPTLVFKKWQSWAFFFSWSLVTITPSPVTNASGSLVWTCKVLCCSGTGFPAVEMLRTGSRVGSESEPAPEPLVDYEFHVHCRWSTIGLHLCMCDHALMQFYITAGCG